MAFVMFLAAACVRFGVQRLRRPTVLTAGAVSATLSVSTLIAAVPAWAVAVLVLSAMLAGAGLGMGQPGGLSLLGSGVPPRHLAEADTALNAGGPVPSGILPVSAGCLSDVDGPAGGATVFGAVLTALAVIGGLVVLATWHQVTDPARKPAGNPRPGTGTGRPLQQRPLLPASERPGIRSGTGDRMTGRRH
ncbi:hypothetical protein [Streptomyces nitrosporeus]|uniref:hypothetical protein n=1 Tax=Streptomyces nitrosporeus TaxID=28894 RepID=UPI00332D71EE